MTPSANERAHNIIFDNSLIHLDLSGFSRRESIKQEKFETLENLIAAEIEAYGEERYRAGLEEAAKVCEVSVCKHGSNERQCYTCELEKENAELTRKGESLCCAYGNALMKIHALEAVAKAAKGLKPLEPHHQYIYKVPAERLWDLEAALEALHAGEGKGAGVLNFKEEKGGGR